VNVESVLHSPVKIVDFDVLFGEHY
jgi:hypothetical protein